MAHSGVGVLRCTCGGHAGGLHARRRRNTHSLLCQQEQWRNQDRWRKRNVQKQRDPTGLACDFACTFAFAYTLAYTFAYTE